MKSGYFFREFTLRDILQHQIDPFAVIKVTVKPHYVGMSEIREQMLQRFTSNATGFRFPFEPAASIPL